MGIFQRALGVHLLRVYEYTFGKVDDFNRSFESLCLSAYLLYFLFHSRLQTYLLICLAETKWKVILL